MEGKATFTMKKSIVGSSAPHSSTISASLRLRSETMAGTCPPWTDNPRCELAPRREIE